VGLAFVFLKNDQFTLTLLGVALVLVAARLVGRLFERLGQPRVIGEVVAGIALGPSLLGHLSTMLFPVADRPLLKMLSSLGLVIFMFLVGLELNLDHMAGARRRVAGAVALSGTVIPFGLGILLAAALYRTHRIVGFVPFALFIGASMSITAFPVLARILIERDYYTKPFGVVAMACAAGDDVLTWATLALVVAIVSSAGSWDLPYTVALSLTFGAVMVRVVRPALARYGGRALDGSTFIAVVVGLLLCAYATSAIGVHEIFGAFLFGAIFPRGRLGTEVRERLWGVAMILLPVFFVSTGLGVDVRGFGLQGLWQFPLILLVACAGKLIGTIIGARSQGLGMRESVGLGVLMNTRGLTELVVLSVGRDLGVIDGRLFTLLVLMALVTTVATAPLLRLVKPDPYLGGGPSIAEVPEASSDLRAG
jgi:Kef-type K+ transport system membrane component KefB